MEEEFYATVKLKTGEEIYAKVCPSEEEHKTFLILFSPIIISQFKNRMGMIGYRVESWLKSTTEDTFIINLDDVLTISESYDIEMMMLYQSYLRQGNTEKKNQSKITPKMGYLANVNDAKEILEKLYRL